MIKASVILAHPHNGSFNHAIFNEVCSVLDSENVTMFRHDLYCENFNPVLTETELGTDSSDDPLVRMYAKELIVSDLLFFIHPNWWGQPPAILKGYIDRVIRPPYAYDFSQEDSGGGIPEGKLAGKTGIVFNTANTEELRERIFFGDPLENIWKQCVFAFCGIEKYRRKTYTIVSDSDDLLRAEWLMDVRSTVINAVAEFRSGI